MCAAFRVVAARRLAVCTGEASCVVLCVHVRVCACVGGCMPARCTHLSAVGHEGVQKTEGPQFLYVRVRVRVRVLCGS